jgi:hypothetical protein
MRKFFGAEDNVWFIGVVEDRHDPAELGRVRVRCYGWHTEDKGAIPTDSLPWAIVLNGTNSASVSGVGDTLHGLLEGAWVFGLFIDGSRAQEPMILGTLPGAPSSLADTQLGFNDPNGVYPKYIDESDVNKLARGTNTKTHTPDSVISEPSEPYNAKYPYNKVYETESGHYKEWDDTTNAERIREGHKTGTFYEIHPDGTKVTHIVADNYTVIASNDNVHVKGNVNIHIDSNATMNVKGNWDVNVDGDVTIDGKTINLNSGSKGAARVDDTADTGDPEGNIGTNKIETGSKTVFIGD